MKNINDLLECEGCGDCNIHIQSVEHSEIKKDAFVLINFWCEHCESVTALRLEGRKGIVSLDYGLGVGLAVKNWNE
jgi:hypothetical protein